MTLIKLFISISFVGLFSLNCFAQNKDEYLYVDTASESGNNSVLTQDAVPTQQTAIPADYNLFTNQLNINTDTVKSLQQSKQFAYAKNLDSLLSKMQDEQAVKVDNKETESWFSRLLNSELIRTFFWTCAIFFVLFIIYRLFFAEVFLQRHTRKTAVQVVKDETEHISPTADYDNKIRNAIMQNNYRAAVRYLYLQSIQKLAVNNIVAYSADKTNYQYVRELAGKNYQQQFASLTHDYEYIWYGECTIDETVFNKIQQNFLIFNSRIG